MNDNPYQSPLQLERDDGKLDRPAAAARSAFWREIARRAKIGGIVGAILGSLTDAICFYFIVIATNNHSTTPMNELLLILLIIFSASTLIGAILCTSGYVLGYAVNAMIVRIKSLFSHVHEDA